MSARDEDVKAGRRFENAKTPIVIAAIAVIAGLAIAGSEDHSSLDDSNNRRVAGGAIVLGAWVVGVAALHRLGRAGSTPRPSDDA